MAASAPITFGPFGGDGGSPWDDGTHTGVRQLVIFSGPILYSIQIEYDDNGEPTWSEKYGTNESGVKHTVKLEYPDELILSISGYSNTVFGNYVIQSLTIESNKRTYGPFGDAVGDYFNFPSIGGKVIGFYGRSGDLVDSIGGYLGPSSVGPFGGNGGEPWDDGVHTNVRELVIFADSIVKSIQILYDDNGESVWSEKHGTNTSGTKYTVTLDCPYEIILSVSGYIDTVLGITVVRSLTIETNKTTYGPFGENVGESFKFPSTNGKIIGFFGRSGDLLDSIGAHVGPLSIGPFGGSGGSPWDDGIHTAVRQLVIYSEPIVYSIQIEYDNCGKSVWSKKHGTNASGIENRVCALPLYSLTIHCYQNCSKYLMIFNFKIAI